MLYSLSLQSSLITKVSKTVVRLFQVKIIKWGKKKQNKTKQKKIRKVKLDPDHYVKLLYLFSNTVRQWNVLILCHQHPLII